MQKRFLFIAIILVVQLVSAAHVFGSYAPKFSQLDTNDGLSMNTVNDVITDNQGYLWVATQSGLHRYDGKDFLLFQKDGTQNNPSGDDISHLHLAQNGTLWLATFAEGINRYNTQDKTFIHYSPEQIGIPSSGITDLSEDNEGNLWIATSDDGIYVFSPKTSNLLHHYDQTELLSPHVTALHFHNQQLWIATTSGIMSYNTEQGLITHEQISSEILSITSQGYNSVWFAGNDNLIEYKLNKNQMIDHSNRLPLRHPAAELKDIKADIYGDLWLSIRHQGLVHISAENTRQYIPNSNDKMSLSTTALGKIWLDKEAQLWIATEGSGIDKLNLANRFLHHIRPSILLNQDINSLDTRSVFRDSQGMLWVGTSQGLYQAIEKKQSIVDLIPFDFPLKGLDKSFISAIKEDNQNQIWIATRGNGLLTLNKDYELLNHFRHDPEDTTSLPSDYIYQIYIDSKHTLWFATRGQGLAHFDTKTQSFIILKDQFGGNEISDIIEDETGNIWVSSYGGGLTSISAEGRITRYDLNTQPSIPSQQLMMLTLVDKQIWAASPEGVFAFNPSLGEYKLYNNENGLIDNAAYLMHKDKDNRIWVGTSKGLSLIFPKTDVIRNFSINDNLQGHEFNFGANFEDPDGTLYFGGTGGFNQILANQQLNQKKPAAPIIESIILMEDSEWLQRSTNFDNKDGGYLTLPHNNNLFSLSFHSPDLKNGATLKYMYKIEGINNNWFTSRNNQINFNGLAPGKYTLSLKAVNLSNDSSDITKIKIRINPPLWLSWWAYCLYVFAALMLLGLIFYVWHQKFKVQQKLLLKLGRIEQRLHLALWSSGDEFWDWEINNQKIIRNNTFLQYADKNSNLYDTAISTVHRDEQESVIEAFKSCIRGESDIVNVCYRGRSIDNKWIWVECIGRVTNKKPNGDVLRMTGIVRNIQALKDKEGELKLLNMELEDRVENRTRELDDSKEHLQATVLELKRTREELTDKVKMANLGSLVASITHEMNTPIGVCITASSNLLTCLNNFNESYRNNQVTESEFQQYQQEVEQTGVLFLDNINRMSKLMNSFKHVAIDQSQDEISHFNFNLYLTEIFQSMRPMLNQTQHQWRINCPENLWLRTNPGYFYQIVSNLVNNSILHAFESDTVGTMELNVQHQDDHIIMHYSDDGSGMSEEVKQQIFCPFFSTKRGQGGCGLGMNIVYNLVTQQLNGCLSVESTLTKGTTISIDLPANLLIEHPRKEA